MSDAMPPALADTVQSLRPFVPAKDFQASKSFYRDLGFTLAHDGADLAILALGPTSFLLQDFYAPGCAENYVLQLLVSDVAAFWRHVETLNLAGRHAVKPPVAPKAMPWGATVGFLFDPSGILWHVTEPVRAVSS
jgi:catechol 2,3-dioxygenase-like lactoylglutathione lyase family enzyme